MKFYTKFYTYKGSAGKQRVAGAFIECHKV